MWFLVLKKVHPGFSKSQSNLVQGSEAILSCFDEQNVTRILTRDLFVETTESQDLIPKNID